MAVLTLGGCGGGSSSNGSGQDTSAIAGTYNGTLSSIFFVDGRGLPRRALPLSASINSTGKIVITDGSVSRESGISGNQFQSRVIVRELIDGNVCDGPEVINGVVNGMTITGTLDTRWTCDLVGEIRLKGSIRLTRVSTGV